jgi:hypothetical protein
MLRRHDTSPAFKHFALWVARRFSRPPYPAIEGSALSSASGSTERRPILDGAVATSDVSKSVTMDPAVGVSAERP